MFCCAPANMFDAACAASTHDRSRDNLGGRNGGAKEGHDLDGYSTGGFGDKAKYRLEFGHALADGLHPTRLPPSDVPTAMVVAQKILTHRGTSEPAGQKTASNECERDDTHRLLCIVGSM